ncbi:MAG: ABC transporter ATP-binding protein [Corticimicrobacter sp.]|uniref:ABC transporter ATP-binding protein n=1 Tax=Corticimicrobacter sp. TaxID=2678536 RepID=UPI0032DB5FE4
MSASHEPLVVVEGLQVVARRDGGPETTIVNNVGFSVGRGEVLALIGESGSGKTTIALSLLGYARRGCRIAGGCVRVDGTDVLALDDRALRTLRGRKVAYVAQSAAASFNPSRTIMNQVIEGAQIHGLMTPQQARIKAVELFRALALPAPETIGERYPHQVSGGQLQRLMAAMALINDPDVVVFDEPTTALDVTTQIDVLRAFKEAIRERHTSAVYVSHDLAVVAQMADRVVVLNGGEIQEYGEIGQILTDPQHPYTRSLLAAARPETVVETVEQAPAAPPSESAGIRPLLEVSGLSAGYGKPDRQGVPPIKVLTDIDLRVARGTTLGIIGESGSGKSSLAWTIAGLVAPYQGQIRFDGRPLAPRFMQRDQDERRRIQLVFQNADTVLNPKRTIEEILMRPLQVFNCCPPDKVRQRVIQLLDMVRLPAAIAQRLPSELSGGQKQRINLARALAAEPDLILCDEVTSALDTVVGAAILELLAELRRELGLAYIFISHDISVVRAICDEVMVLYRGKQVDHCARGELTVPPRHPYTDLLVNSVPELRQGWLEEATARISADRSRQQLLAERQ